MPEIRDITVINAELLPAGPKGNKGDKGDPGFLQFKIVEGNLILVNETPDKMRFRIIDGELIMEVAE